MTFESETCEVIITAADGDWLAGFSGRLVADRLCAAVHNLSPIRSIYWWQGEMHDAFEARAALHTRVALVPQIVDRTNREHPYAVPCVAVLPIIAGNPAYLEWISRETASPGMSSGSTHED